MSQDLLDIGYSGIALVLIAAWRALPLLAIALLADLALRRRLAAKYHVLLWALVVARLLLPFSAPTLVSWQGPMNGLAERLLSAFDGDVDVAGNQHSPNAVWVPTYHLMPHPMPLPDLAAAHQPQTPAITWTEVLAATLLGIWAVVATGAIVRTVLAHLRFASRLRHCPFLDDPMLVAALSRECVAMKISRQPRLREVPNLSSPAVFGLFRHTICLPPAALQTLSAEELRWVLRHELAHIRRRDMWLLSLASVVQAFHWFNPLAWLTVAKLRGHVEAAADELALEQSSKTDAVAYGHLLLRLAEQATESSPTPAIGLLQIISSRSLRGRIEQLTQDRQPSRKWMRPILGIAVLALAAVGLTDASEPELNESLPPPAAFDLPRGELTVDFGSTRQGPKAFGDDEVSVSTYDVAEVLEKIRRSDWEEEPEEALLNYIPGTIPHRSLRIDGSKLTAKLTKSEHEELSRLIAAWRLGGLQQVVLEVRVVQADVRLATSLDWSSQKVDSPHHRSSRPVVATTASDAEMRRFIQGVQADAHSNILMAPKVTVFNGQTAAIEMLTQRPFVTSVRPLKDGAMQPIIEVVDEGLKLGLHAVCLENQTIDLEVDLRATTIEEVALATLPFTDPKSAKGPTMVQVPEVATTSIHIKAHLADGETLLMAAPQPFDEKGKERPQQSLFYSITPRLIEE